MTSSSMTAARSQYLLDLFAQVPDPRKRRGRRHQLAGLLAVGITAVIAGSRSFAAIGQWAADAGPEVLAGLGAVRGPAEESTFRRGFALVSGDVPDRVLGAWLPARAVRASGWLVLAIDVSWVARVEILARTYLPFLIFVLQYELVGLPKLKPFRCLPLRPDFGRLSEPPLRSDSVRFCRWLSPAIAT
jgi:DDE_Tnp_1-associated